MRRTSSSSFRNELPPAEHLRMEAHYKTVTYRYTVLIAVAIARGTAKTPLGLASRLKKWGLQGVFTQD